MIRGSLLYYLVIVLVVIQACVDFGDSVQEYPKLKWDSIESIRISGEFEKTIKDGHIFDRINSLFADSSNFYPGEKVKPNKNKKEMTVDLMTALDTLSLWFYPAETNGKYEIGFLDSYDPGQPNKFRKFNRFYMNDKLIQLLKNTSN